CHNEKGGRNERQDGSVRYCDLNLSAFLPLSHGSIGSRSEWRCLGLLHGKRRLDRKRSKIEYPLSHRLPPHTAVRHQGDGDKQEQWSFRGCDHQRSLSLLAQSDYRCEPGGSEGSRVLRTYAGFGHSRG